MPGPLTKPTLAQRLTPHLQPQRVVGGFALSLLGGIVQPFAWSLLLVFLSLVGFCIWSLRSAEEAAKLPPLVDGEGRPLSAEPRAIVLPNDPGSPQPTAAPPEPPKPSWQPSPRVRTTALVLAILCLLASIPFAVGAVQSKDSIFQRTYAKLVDVEEAVDDVQDGVEHLQEDTEGIKADTEDIKADLAALREALKAATPTDDGSLSPDSEGDAEILDRALLRLAEDAQRGVETARRALEDASPEEAGDYFMDQLAKLDAGRDAIEARLDEEEVELSREAAEVLFRTGRIDDAEAALQRILARLPDDLDATNRLGHVYQLRGDYPAAEGRYRRLLELAPEEPAWRATALGNLGLIAQIRRDLDEAERLHRESLEINRTLGRLKGQANQLGNLGVIARNRRDLDQAERLLRESLEINRTLDRLEGQAVALGNLGLIAWNRGDLDQAERLHRESLEINRTLGRLEGQAVALGNLGVIARNRRDLDEAERLLRESLEINRTLGRLKGQAVALGNLGLIARNRRDLDEAERLHRESLEINRTLGRLEGQAVALGNLGVIAGQRGNSQAARDLWTQSRDLYARIGIAHMAERLQGWLDGLPAE